MDVQSSPTPPPPDPAYFDKLVAMAAKICGTPVALTNYFSRGWQHTVASIGICPSPMRREDTICEHAVKYGELFIVPDTLADERFSLRSYVAGPPYIRFYAGMPIFGSDREALAALCVLDYVPRQLSDRQRLNLRQLALVLSSSLRRSAA